MKTKKRILIVLFCIFSLFVAYFAYVSIKKQIKIKKQISLFDVDVLTDYDLIHELNLLMKETVQVFNENDLAYWAFGGNLIGAFRDKGAVPWDDDADLCILDYDLKKLLEMKTHLNKRNIEIVTYRNSKAYKVFFKNGTDIKREFKTPFIDIFVLKKEGENAYMLDIETNKTIKKGYFKNDYFKFKDLFPIKLYQYEDFQISGPNYPFEYLNRAFKNWQTTGISSHHIESKYSPTVNKKFKIHYYNPNITKPYLWLFNHSLSSHNEKIINENLTNYFEITMLGEYKIKNLMPEIKSIQLNKALNYHLISAMFLYKYGGVFVDSASASITIKLIDVIEKLKKYEFIAFGCDSNGDCNKPSTAVMSSRPKRILMENYLKRMIKSYNEQEDNSNKYTNLGETILWDEIVDLKKKFNYEYFHFKNI